MSYDKYLPIGTVVILKNAKKRLMITGFLTTREEEPGVVYDYSGCLYPEGFISSERILVFNHNQIEKVFSLGYSDEEEKAFKIRLSALESELN